MELVCYEWQVAVATHALDLHVLGPYISIQVPNSKPVVPMCVFIGVAGWWEVYTRGNRVT